MTLIASGTDYIGKKILTAQAEGNSQREQTIFTCLKLEYHMGAGSLHLNECF